MRERNVIREVLLGFAAISIILLTLNMGVNAITISNVTNKTSMATTVWILWNVSSEANNTVEYSINSDLSDASFSSWDNNTDTPKIKLWNLQPDTIYYYRVWSYNTTNESDNVSSSIYNFTTRECVVYKLVNATDTSITGIDHPIQEAVDMICPAGGEVELAAGTYYLPQGGTITLTIHKNQESSETPIQVGPYHWIGYKDYKYAIILNERHNITIRGAGINDTILINAGESYPEYHMIFIVKGSNNIIEDLSIKNNYTGWIPDDAGNGIKIFGKAENIAISNIKAERFSAGIGAGVTLHVLKEYHAIENLTVSNCLLTYNKIGIVGLYTYNSTITNCEACYSTSYGVELNEGCSDNIIEKIVSHDNGNAGIHIYDNSWRNVVRDNICYRNGKSGGEAGIWVFTSSIDSIVTNNTCRDNYNDGIAIGSQVSTPDRITVSHNLIYNNKRHGIRLYATRDVRTDRDPPYDITIESNTIYNNSGDGIVHGFEQNLELYDITVRNNIITNNGGYGINHGSNESQSQLILSYNDVWGNALGNYNNTTSGTGDISEDPLFADLDNNDFHLKSEAGRWNGTDWVYDNETSPCIDAGDPNSTYSNETYPHGQKINMGAYGNTIYASRSPYHKIYLSVPMTIYSNGEYSYPEPPITYKDNQTVNITFNVTDTMNLTVNSYTSSEINFTATNTTADQKMNVTVYNGTFEIINGKEYEIKKDGVVQQTKTASDNKVIFTDIPVGSDYVITEKEEGEKEHKLPVARPVMATGITLLIIIAYWRYRRRRRRIRMGVFAILHKYLLRWR